MAKSFLKEMQQGEMISKENSIKQTFSKDNSLRRNVF